MKKIILVMAVSLCVNFGFGQDTILVEFTEGKELLLNKKKLTAETTLEVIKEELGEPEIYKEYVTGKVNYHYKDLGISVHTINGKLLMIGFNFNWDGDKTFPEKSYIGKLIVDGVAVEKDSKNNILDEMQHVDFNCVMEGMCVAKPKEDRSIFMMTGFKEGEITQFGFELH